MTLECPHLHLIWSLNTEKLININLSFWKELLFTRDLFLYVYFQISILRKMRESDYFKFQNILSFKILFIIFIINKENTYTNTKKL